jgi:uncharacterized membrane protein
MPLPQRVLFILGFILIVAALLGIVSRLVRPLGVHFVFNITSFWAPFLFGISLVVIGFILRVEP